jgi:hypothetical protein
MVGKNNRVDAAGYEILPCYIERLQVGRMSKVKQIQQLIERYNLESMIQSGMPGYRITLYTKEYRQIFCGNSSEALAYLQGYGQALHLTNQNQPFYNPEFLPDWYINWAGNK